AVLGFPGEAFAHRVELDQLAETRQRVALAGMPGTLDELHDADAAAVSEHPQRETECRGRLSLAGAGVDDQQALFDGLVAQLRILVRLALFHLLPVTVVLVGHITSPARGCRPRSAPRGRPFRQSSG